MLPSKGYKQKEVRVHKNFTFRLDKPTTAIIKKTISNYKKLPFEVTNGAEALRFMALTFRSLDDVGFFTDPVVVERFKELSAKK